jgi:hypothetical protein
LRVNAPEQLPEPSRQDLLDRTRQDGFEMWRLLLTRNDADFNPPKGGRLEPSLQIALLKSKEPIPIQLMRELKRGVVQCLAQDDQIHASALNGWVFEVTKPELQVFQVVLFGFGRPKATIFSELSTAITLLAAARQKLADEPFAGAQVRYHQRRQNAQQQMPKACHERPGPYTRSNRPATWLK